MSNKAGIVCGVGINDANYSISKGMRVNGKWIETWRCPYYEKWVSMLKRCYLKREQEKHPTYKGCIVCDECLLFSNFKAWMELQNWENRALDKDFLIEGNKVYSPSTCVFIPQSLNNFTTTSRKVRGQHPLGVRYMKKHKNMVNEYSKPYESRIGGQSTKSIYLGVYTTSEEAHEAYLKAKLEHCGDYLVEFKNEGLIMKGLIRIYKKIKYHIDNNLKLTSF